MIADSGLAVAIAAVVVGFVLTCLVGLLGLVFTGVQRDIRDNTDAVERNAKHLDSIITTLWQTIWRITSMEDYLESGGYHPPRLINRPPDDPLERRQSP